MFELQGGVSYIQGGGVVSSTRQGVYLQGGGVTLRSRLSCARQGGRMQGGAVPQARGRRLHGGGVLKVRPLCPRRGIHLKLRAVVLEAAAAFLRRGLRV
jgi:hypothetical protein